MGDIYLIKTDSLGNVDWVKDISTKPQEIEIDVFPNPFNESCRITVEQTFVHAPADKRA